jgi:hypothetical protein
MNIYRHILLQLMLAISIIGLGFMFVGLHHNIPRYGAYGCMTAFVGLLIFGVLAYDAD